MAYSPYWNKRMETIPLSRLRAIQERKLRKQITYLTENSPFYRRKFKEAGVQSRHIRTLADLKEIPFTTKDELRESQIKSPPLGEHAAVPLEKVLRLHSSSGTSGESLPVEEGVEGEIVFTHIDRECVPLVRFRSRDRVVVWTKPCRCRRTGFRLRIVGRTDDMLILRGVNVFPSAIKDLISQMRPKTTGEIQVLLEQPGPRVEPPLRIQVEYGAEVNDLSALKGEVEENLKNKLAFSPAVELVPAGTLPRFEMKAKLVRKLYEE